MLKRFSLQTAVRRLAFLWAKSNLQMCFFSSVLESVFEKCELVDNIKNSGVFTYESRFLASFEKFQDENALQTFSHMPATGWSWCAEASSDWLTGANYKVFRNVVSQLLSS